MKKIIILSAFVFGCLYNSFCQKANTIIIKPGEGLSGAFNFIYKYPEFKYGKVFFTNGDKSAGKLNYNILMQTIQFIDAKGDTLALANERSLHFISIDADTFLYNTSKGYMEQVTGNSFIKLLLKENIQSNEEKAGAYGISSSNEGIDTKATVVNGQSYKLSVNSITNLTKKKEYYFTDATLSILPVNNKNILKAFAKEKQQIENYLRLNNIDFNKEDDLKKLFMYLVTIV